MKNDKIGYREYILFDVPAYMNKQQIKHKKTLSEKLDKAVGVAKLFKYSEVMINIASSMRNE